MSLPSQVLLAIGIAQAAAKRAIQLAAIGSDMTMGISADGFASIAAIGNDMKIAAIIFYILVAIFSFCLMILTIESSQKFLCNVIDYDASASVRNYCRQIKHRKH